MKYLPCVEIEPRQPATASIIWMHGLGASGHDFEPIVPQLQLPDGLAVRFVFPHAPQQAVTINNGLVMPAWYDILAIGPGSPVDAEGIRRSADRIDDLIERENQRGVPAERIIIAGFSQGGAIGYEVALRHPRQLAGLMALSSYFATRESIRLHDANRHIPILVCHGSYDPMISEERGMRTIAALEEQGYQPEFHRYPMEHAICAAEIDDIAAFLRRVLT